MDIKLPKLGEGADSGTVVNVLVQEGDQVEKGQILIELENEKAVAPIPSTAAGTVRSLRVKMGDKVAVGQVLAVLDGGGGSSQSPPPQETTKKDSEAPRPSPPAASDARDTSAPPAGVVNPDPVAPPSVRKLARQVGIDLTRVSGSGSGGRIEREDLQRYVARLQDLAARPAQARESAPSADRIDFSQWGPVRKVAMTPIRKTISRRMVENWQSIPHVTQFEELDITQANGLRKALAESYEAKGTRLTLTPLVIRALVDTLKKHPIFNASLDETTGEIVFKDYFHIGLAVDTEQGLLVPVLRDADKKGMVELAQVVTALAEKARQRRLSLEEMRGGTFTLSNQGGLGGSFFTPIINKPEVAILGLGRGQLKLRPGSEGPQTRLLMPVGLSYDHRLIDGGSAARFVTDLGAALAGMTEEELRPED